MSELARRVGMSRALLYTHFAKLEEAGFVAVHRGGGQPTGRRCRLKEIFYSLWFWIGVIAVGA